MSTFGHLKKLEVVPGRTREFPLYDLEEEPVLTVGPATSANKGYNTEILKRGRKVAALINSGNIGEELATILRGDDRKLYPVHVIKGWKGVIETGGEEVPFTPENCADFLRALPDWIFDKVRAFASDPRNFIEESLDAEAAAKNS